MGSWAKLGPMPGYRDWGPDGVFVLVFGCACLVVVGVVFAAGVVLGEAELEEGLCEGSDPVEAIFVFCYVSLLLSRVDPDRP